MSQKILLFLLLFLFIFLPFWALVSMLSICKMKRTMPYSQGYCKKQTSCHMWMCPVHRKSALNAICYYTWVVHFWKENTINNVLPVQYFKTMRLLYLVLSFAFHCLCLPLKWILLGFSWALEIPIWGHTLVLSLLILSHVKGLGNQDCLFN
jgi:hypothetical protein